MIIFTSNFIRGKVFYYYCFFVRKNSACVWGTFVYCTREVDLLTESERAYCALQSTFKALSCILFPSQHGICLLEKLSNQRDLHKW